MPGLVIGAVALRLAFLVIFPDMGTGELLDSTRYLRVARNLIIGRGFAEYRLPTALLPPGYPYFLAGFSDRIPWW